MSENARSGNGKRNLILVTVLVVVLAACAWFARGRVHFDWANLKLQMHAMHWWRVAAGVLLIWLSVALRAPRWRVLLGSAGTGSSANLIGPQFVGFTVVALFGRAADLARPYLVARHTRTPIATNLAVYLIERALDLAAAAILFAVTLALVPATMPHYEQFKIAGKLALAGVAAITVFLAAVRFAGGAVASLTRKVFRVVSPAFAESAADKITEFGAGLRTITSFGQFAAAFALSLAIWIALAAVYLEVSRAFASSAELARFTIPQTMLLMASSMAGSLLQLPIVGWFSQIVVLGGAYHVLFNAPLEVASAAGAILMAVTTLGIVPAGLLAAKIEGVGLRDAASVGEAAGGHITETGSASTLDQAPPPPA